MKKFLLPVLISGFALITASNNTIAEEELIIPFKYSKGQFLFERNCSSCHGADLNGSKKGPPLLHPFYKPSHHGDQSFYRAAMLGVKAHHWDFGDMPPIQGMTETKIKSIVKFIRYFQKQKQLY